MANHAAVGRSWRTIGRRAIVVLLLVGAACGLTNLVRPAAANPDTAPAARPDASTAGQQPSLAHAELYDAVIAAIDKNFIDPALIETTGWHARAEALRPLVLSAASRDDAIRLINGLLSELKTSHTELFGPDEYRYYITLDVLRGAPGTKELLAKIFPDGRSSYSGVGIFTSEVNGRHFIDGILEGSQAETIGLKFGDEILSVDGQTYSPVAAFRGRIGTTVALDIRRTAGAAPQRYELPVISTVPSEAFAAAINASTRIITRQGQRIGYIHVWSTNTISSIRTAFARLEDHAQGQPLDALIVDMRGRVGGNSGVAGQLLDMLGTAPKPYWGKRRIVTREGVDVGLRIDRTLSANAGSVQPFKGRTAVLVNHQTRSAAELMAYGYQRSKFGLVFGSTTAGAMAGGAPYAMPGDLVLYVAGARLEFDGRNLDGIGVVPDRSVARPLPYADGADPVLDAAVAHLAEAGSP